MTLTLPPPSSCSDRGSGRNPLLEGLGHRRGRACVLVIFGATGDLTHRKIFPALYAARDAHSSCRGTSRSSAQRARDWSDDEFRDQMETRCASSAATTFDQDVWDWLAKATHYVAVDFADRSEHDKLAAAPQRARRRARHARATASSTSQSRRSAMPMIVEARAASVRTSRRLDAPHRREAVRPRPRRPRAS